MIINHNMNAMNAQRNMGINTRQAGKSMEKLSSGLRINRAGDDAAGLAISEKMRAQVRGLDQASRNSEDAISMIQTAEGALNETHSILQRMRELAVQAGNDTNTTSDRGEIQKEINQLTSEINRIGNTTEFNNQKLLNGSSVPKASGAVLEGGIDKGGSAVSVAATGTLKFSDELPKEGTKITAGKDIFTLYDSSKNPTAPTGANVIAIDIKGLTTTESVIDKIVAAKTEDKVTLTKVGTSGIKIEAATTGAAGNAIVLKSEGPGGISGKGYAMQVGANENQTMTVDFNDMRSEALGLTGTDITKGYSAAANVTNGTNNVVVENSLNVGDATNAGKAVTTIQKAIDSVSAERSKLGAFQNRLEHTINNLGTSSENLTAAESRIRDVDMAKEMMTFSKNNILQQAAQAMLAQANQQPQNVLQLLR